MLNEETRANRPARAPAAARRTAGKATTNGKSARPSAAEKNAHRSETIGFLMWDTRRAVSRDFERLITVHGVTRSTFWILRILWAEDGLTQAQISHRCRMRGPTIVGIVAQLEREKLVTRANDPGDSRKKVISLTPKGRALKDVIMPIVEDVNKRATKGFTAAEKTLMKDLLHRMRLNMEAE